MAKVWGMPTWVFLHTLLAKIPENQYVAVDVLNQVKSICSVLPCPDCAAHATAYMAKIDPKHVQTKEQFKHVLWGFHNFVNKRTNKPIVSIDSIRIYDTLSFPFIYNVFLREFLKPQNIPKLFIDSMIRTRIMNQFKSWISSIKF